MRALGKRGRAAGVEGDGVRVAPGQEQLRLVLHDLLRHLRGGGRLLLREGDVERAEVTKDRWVAFDGAQTPHKTEEAPSPPEARGSRALEGADPSVARFCSLPRVGYVLCLLCVFVLYLFSFLFFFVTCCSSVRFSTLLY